MRHRTYQVYNNKIKAAEDLYKRIQHRIDATLGVTDDNLVVKIEECKYLSPGGFYINPVLGARVIGKIYNQEITALNEEEIKAYPGLVGNLDSIPKVSICV